MGGDSVPLGTAPIFVFFEARGSTPAPTANTAPVAVNDTATVAEGATASIDVAANDTDASNARWPLTI